MAYVEGDIPVSVGTNNGYNGGFGGFGEGWWGIILIALLFGWGRNNFGGYGNGAGAQDNYVLASDFATIQRQLSDGFGNLTSQTRYIQNGICDGFYAMNTSLLNGFNGTNMALMQNGYETRNAINGVSQQLASCCCDIREQISGVNYNMAQQFATTNYNMAKNTCDIIQAGHNDTQRIIDYLSGEKIASLQAENVALKGQISQNCQTATILNAVNRTPVPAYVVANPYCCNGGCGSVQ